MNSDQTPDIELKGFSLWVDGYQFPDWIESTDSREYWDANWVNVRVRCMCRLGIINLAQPCLQLPELERWRDACLNLYAGHVTSAELPTMEPELKATITIADAPDRFLLAITLRADRPPVLHTHRCAIKSSGLLQLVESLNGILARLPIRGTRPVKATRKDAGSNK